jgi:hypothetical protein
MIGEIDHLGLFFFLSNLFMFDYFEGSWDGILVIVTRSQSELLWNCFAVPARSNRSGMTLITCLLPVLRLRMTGAMHVSPHHLLLWHALITLRVAEALYVVFWFYRKPFC